MVEKYRDMMVADGYEPDSSTQKALVLAYSKAGQFEKAEGGAGDSLLAFGCCSKAEYSFPSSGLSCRQSHVSAFTKRAFAESVLEVV
jgi:hypothetical protein